MGDGLPDSPWESNRRRIDALEKKISILESEVILLAGKLQAEPSLHIDYTETPHRIMSTIGTKP